MKLVCPANVPTFMLLGKPHTIWPENTAIIGALDWNLAVQQPDGTFDVVAYTEKMFSLLGEPGYSGAHLPASWVLRGTGAWPYMADVLCYCGIIGAGAPVSVAQDWMRGKTVQVVVISISRWINEMLLPFLKEMVQQYLVGKDTGAATSPPAIIEPLAAMEEIARRLIADANSITIKP